MIAMRSDGEQRETGRSALRQVPEGRHESGDDVARAGRVDNIWPELMTRNP